MNSYRYSEHARYHGNIYKDGFHIMYPNIWIIDKIQYLIRKEVVNIFYGMNDDMFVATTKVIIK